MQVPKQCFFPREQSRKQISVTCPPHDSSGHVLCTQERTPGRTPSILPEFQSELLGRMRIRRPYIFPVIAVGISFQGRKAWSANSWKGLRRD
ncbi:hypothetical protein CDAR_241011 [Caerostris darwini]|uniref:Uncharacterized protein n=1 Tax=Caerostris darwini TaxID=1538125 RepID=A0AAV4TFH3_9ARAC|nr:hypothetical protein CDAR_241011 [Caerostris darwini]